MYTTNRINHSNSQFTHSKKNIEQVPVENNFCSYKNVSILATCKIWYTVNYALFSFWTVKHWMICLKAFMWVKSRFTRTVVANTGCFHWLASCSFDSLSCANTTLLVGTHTRGTLGLLSNRGKVSLGWPLQCIIIVYNLNWYIWCNS